jgi:hypothetical protein
MLANAGTLIPVPLINNDVAFSGYSRLASLMWAALHPALLNLNLPLHVIFRAIGGVRNPIMSVLRIVAFTPLLIRLRVSKLGVVADLRKFTYRIKV